MKVTNLETMEVGGMVLLEKELGNTWGVDPRVIKAIFDSQKYEDHVCFTDNQGWHSKGVYVTPFEDGKMSLEVHWAFRPYWGGSYGGCDLELEIVV